MKLFLASQAKHPDTFKKLDNYIGGFRKKKIVYIPTAENGEYRYGEWMDKSPTWKMFNNSGAIIMPLVLEEHHSDLTNSIFNCDAIFVSGGRVGYLNYWARRCGLDEILSNIIKDKIYIGSSAGSMLLCKSSEMYEWNFFDSERGASQIAPLGLVDFDIYPHYEDHLYDQIKKLYKGKKLYLLKNGEEIIVEDDKITVVGEERIITNE